MKITVLFPTKTEASLFKRDRVTSMVSGVGLTATAAATMKVILQDKPDILILAGIAGVFPHAPFKVGDVVLVDTEVEGDLGFFTPAGFVHMAHLPLAMDFERRHTLTCPYIPAGAPFPLAHGISLNAAMAAFADTRHVAIENMEGAAFFHVCQQEQQRFLELRAISNVVELDENDWDMQASVQALTTGLNQLIDLLQEQR